MTFNNRTRCPHCKKKLDAGQRIHPECIDDYAEAQAAKAEREQAKKARAAAKVERAETKRRKLAIKTRAEWLAEAKKLVQKRRRLEELAKGNGCMSCGRSQSEVMGTDGWKPGGAWDGGHFMSKGARPELALEPLNIWLQCKSCNGGSGKYARKGYTVNAAFEVNLIASEGAELVDWLKGPHDPKHFSVDDLITICAQERQKLKELQA
jgi:glutaredoxin